MTFDEEMWRFMTLLLLWPQPQLNNNTINMIFNSHHLPTDLFANLFIGAASPEEEAA